MNMRGKSFMPRVTWHITSLNITNEFISGKKNILVQTEEGGHASVLRKQS